MLIYIRARQNKKVHTLSDQVFLILQKKKRTIHENRIYSPKWNRAHKFILCFLFRWIQIIKWIEQIYIKKSIIIFLIWCEKRLYLHIAKLAYPKKEYRNINKIKKTYQSALSIQTPEKPISIHIIDTQRYLADTHTHTHIFIV